MLKTWYISNNIILSISKKKIFFFFWFIKLIWLFECLILTILTLTKCLQSLLRDSSLSVILITEKSPFQVVSVRLKMSKDNFFWDTQYCLVQFLPPLSCLSWSLSLRSPHHPSSFAVPSSFLHLAFSSSFSFILCLSSLYSFVQLF